MHIVCGQVASSATDLRVTEVDFRRDPRWEVFVVSHPRASIYHHSGWLEALENENGQRCTSLACEDIDGNLHGVLPLFYTRGLPFNVGPERLRCRLSSLPRTPIAGPLTSNSRATVCLIRAAIKKVECEPGCELEIKTQDPGLDRLIEGVVCVPWRMTYVQELPDQEEKIHFGDSRNHARIKWSVNKAIKSGVHVRTADTESDLRAWYRIYLGTMCAKVLPARPYRFFAGLWASMNSRGLMRLLLAEDGRKKLLAGSVFLSFGRTVSYTFNASCEEDLRLRPNDILQWTAIHDACRRGFQRYDLGEVPEGHLQLAEFKRKWGARPKRLYRYYYPASVKCPTDP